MLQEETAKVDDLIATGIEFSESDIDKRQTILENSENQELDFVYSNLVDSGKNTIEQYIKLYLLSAIQTRGEQLNCLLQENTKKKQEAKQFDTFNPVSFGPGAPINQTEFVSKLEEMEGKMDKDLKNEVQDLADRVGTNEKTIEELTEEIEILKANVEKQKVDSEVLEKDQEDFKAQVSQYENEFVLLEAELKKLEEQNQLLVSAL